MSPLEVVGIAAGAGGVVSVVLTAAGFALKRRQTAIDQGRGQGKRDAEVSMLRATVDYHNDKIGELDDWKQDAGKVLAKLSEGYDWIKGTLEDLKGGVDELRRRS